MPSLAIIPTFVRSDDELKATVKTLETLRNHEPSLEALVVDDKSPEDELVERLREECEDRDVRFTQREVNGGFACAVNVGLREARKRGIDAILLNADMEFLMPFVEIFEQTKDSQDRPAAVVGALLIYPTGLVQHGGVFLSLYNRSFDHKYKYGPAGLPEAQQMAVCPVTGAMFYIRHDTLEKIGIFDEDYGLAFEDVDYCLRVFNTGLECVYNPAVRAIHHESMFRGKRSDQIDEWHQKSLGVLHQKHGTTPLGRFVQALA